MTTFDGETQYDRRLWHSYIYLAKRYAIASGGRTASSTPAIADDPSNRVGEPLVEALQTVLFSAFALEYRLKRVLIAMGQPPRQKDTLTPLFEGFWTTLSHVNRLDGKGRCAPPAEWASCEPTLKELISVRNQMAHANYKDVLEFLGRTDPLRRARRYYNTLVDAIMLINLGTGYETRPLYEVEDYFRPLKVAD
jgi:hypothetical protein